MKTTKKIVSILLALVMVLSLATTAFAEDGEATPATYSITINNKADGHTYEAYQIFKGDLHESTLSNITWGDNVTNSNGLDAAAIAERMDTNYTGADELSVEDLLGLIKLGGDPVTSTDEGDTYVIDGLEPGYYLVKDASGSLNGKDDTYTRYIVKVVKDVTTAPKSSSPTVEKKVDDENDSVADDSNTPDVDEGEDKTTWQDSADYDIGDDVPFKLEATLANDVSSYKGAYTVIFHDTLSAGLTYNDDFKVYVGSVSDENEVTDKFTDSYDSTTGKLTISCEDVRDFAGDSAKIIVLYTAKLNENAVIGAAGNPNEVYLEYSNNPNWSAEGDNVPGDEPSEPSEPTEPDQPTEPEEPESPPTGNTPEDVVIVFTYKVDVNKVDENLEPLTGAEFKLEKLQEDGTWKDIELTVDGATFSAVGLDDGFYKISETKAPAGYNSVAPIYFKVEATHDELADNPTLKTLTVTVTDENGTPIADANADPETGELGTFEVTLESGSISTDVVNKPGTVLPETGGVGTTIFYILGAVLMLGTAVVLVARKRMSVNA